MRKFFCILRDIIADATAALVYFVKSNLMNFANILSIICAYVMYFLGQRVVEFRGKFGVGGEIFIPLAFAVLIYIIRQFANKVGKGVTIPVPQKRFTSTDEDDEVSIEQNRLQELILYIADVEDWLERHGLL